MRYIFTLLHRYVGLVVAIFLIFSGLTGAIISWDHEIDDWLNPHLMEAKSLGSPISPIDIAKRIEARYPEVRVTNLPINHELGESYRIGVSPKQNPETQRLYEPGFNQVFIDPFTGKELGKRQWGQVWPITQETFVSFLYKLHYSLHMPEMWGTDRWGIWLLGIVAILWALDSFVGFYLTFPVKRRVMVVDKMAAQGNDDVDELTTGDLPISANKSWWQRWQPAWRVRWTGGAAKLIFDLHRAIGLWTWILLFVIAFTAFSLNLYREVFYPIMTVVSKVTPTPFDSRTRAPKHVPIAPLIELKEVIKQARADANNRGWHEPVGSVSYNQAFGIFGVQFYYPKDGHGAGGVGHKRLYYDSQDGRYLGDRQPWQGTVADIFVQAQFPLHSGRILGLPGRILISVMGLVVAILSITGILVWWRKRASRRKYAGKIKRN